MRSKITQILLCILILNPLSSFSFPQSLPENSIYPMDKWSINGSIGYLQGESNEYVYGDGGRQLSELDWKIQGATVIKAELMADLLPWLTANVNGWGTIDNSTALMDDYDWFNPHQSSWTHWSHHPDTELTEATNIDFNLRGWLLQNQNYKLGITTGYQQTSFDFLAKGGCYQYNNGLQTGCFPDHMPMIDYQQTFKTTYLGLTGKYLLNNNFELSATLKYSPWVKSSDVDEHYARDITFTESGDNSTFSSAALSAGYYFSRQTKVFFEAAFIQFTNGMADTEYNDHSNGIIFIRDAAGLSNQNYVLSLGIQYTPEYT